MTFKRPQNITLTQMAQWVDSIDFCNYNHDTLVEYLYHLVLYNSQKKAFFNEQETYDDFTLFCVSKLLIRLNNKTAQPLKSVVNYINTALEYWYAEYVRYHCSGYSDIEVHDFDVSDFADYLIDTTSSYDYNAYNVGCLSISEVIRKHIVKLPRKKESAEWSNIYLSCLLTLQDRIDTAIKLCGNTMMSGEPQLVNRIIRSLRSKPPILFHLSETWSNYILVVVNELIHAISAELSYATHIEVSPSTCLKNLVVAAMNDED